jgi:hypothetical protein
MLENLSPYRITRQPGIDCVPPTRREGIERAICGFDVPAQVSLEVLHAHVNQHVDPFQLGKPADDLKRQVIEVKRIEECKVQSVRIQFRGNLLHGLIRWPDVTVCSNTERSQAAIALLNRFPVYVGYVNLRERSAFFICYLECNDGAAVDDFLSFPNPRLTRARKQINIGSARLSDPEKPAAHGSRNVYIPF